MIMAEKKSIRINFIMNVILTLSSIVFPLITFPYVSRILLAEGTGKVAFALSVVLYFNMFSKLGIPVYGIRECARVRDDKEKLTMVYQELLLISLIMSAVTYLVLAGSVYFIPKLRSEKELYIVLGSLIWLETIGVEWLYKGLEQYTYIAVRSVIFKAIGIAAMFVMVTKRSDYVRYAIVMIIASYLSYVLNFINVRKYVFVKPLGNYDFSRHLKSIMIFFAMSCATTIYTNLDSVMLGFMTSDDQVGLYYAATRVKYLLVCVVTSLGAVLLPRLSWYIEQHKKEEFEKMCKKAMNLIFLSALPLMTYFMLFSKTVLLILSGTGFLSAGSSMRIIMPTLLLIGITNVLGIQVLVPTGREKYVLYSEIAGAVTDLILNALLIPVYKADGAAIGTLVAEAVVLLVQVWALRKDVVIFFSGIQYFRIVIPTVVSAAVTYFLVGPMDLSEPVRLCFSGLLFFTLYIILLILTGERLTGELLKDMIRFCHKGKKQ